MRVDVRGVRVLEVAAGVLSNVAVTVLGKKSGREKQEAGAFAWSRGTSNFRDLPAPFFLVTLAANLKLAPMLEILTARLFTPR